MYAESNQAISVRLEYVKSHERNVTILKLNKQKLLKETLEWSAKTWIQFMFHLQKSFSGVGRITRTRNARRNYELNCAQKLLAIGDSFDKYELRRTIEQHCAFHIEQFTYLLDEHKKRVEHHKKNLSISHLGDIYLLRNSTGGHPVKTCPGVPESRRNLLYRTLLQWKRFADQHDITWWITYGSLLGAYRTGDIIPYDSDMDLAILGSDEAKLRLLARNRTNIVHGEFNLITRPGAHCPYDGGERLDCHGNPVHGLVDTCAFCGPLARIFFQLGHYIDIYVTLIQANLDSNGNLQTVGYFDEGLQEYTTSEEVNPVNHIFPLRACKLMNLTVPCPNKPREVLSSVYGPNFVKPLHLCDQMSGKWVNQ